MKLKTRKQQESETQNKQETGKVEVKKIIIVAKKHKQDQEKCS